MKLKKIILSDCLFYYNQFGKDDLNETQKNFYRYVNWVYFGL